ncbi:hypothetical protein D9M69_531200 [compost metagenome]
MFLGFQLHRIDRLAIQIGDDLAAVRAGAHVAVTRAVLGEDGFPVEAHAHANAAEDEELLALGGHTQLLAQFDELDQGVWAVEDPDEGVGYRLLDFPSPLVNQVRG